VSQEFLVKQLPNGLTLLGEPMPAVRSAAMTILVRAGSSRDPQDLAGSAAVGSEWLFRGAADRDSRQLNDALDDLGTQHHEDVHSEHLQLSTVQLGRTLPQVVDLYADILTAPTLAEATFAPCRDLVAQDLQSLEDQPARNANALLREKFFPWPLGRLTTGSAETLAAMTPQAVGQHLRDHLTPDGSILAIAGQFDWDALCSQIGNRLGDWTGTAPQKTTPQPNQPGVTHLKKESAQVHIALAHPAVPFNHEQYYAARLSAAVLSQGMGSRLFTEVREKRGLAYHVSSSYVSLKDHAGLFTYVGTRPDLARQSHDVTVEQLQKLGEHIEADELARAKTQLRSLLVMQGASSSSRAGSLAGDWYHLARLRSLEEISEAIEKTTVDDCLAYLREHPAENFTVLTIGPEPILEPSASE
jgi:predicted Zn-dependent peptidase